MNQEDIILHLEEILRTPRLAASWQFAYVEAVRRLLPENLYNEWLGKGALAVQKLILGENKTTEIYKEPADLLKLLAEGGACIQRVKDCLILPDHDAGQEVPASGAQPMRPTKFAPKFRRIILALYDKGFRAENLEVYIGEVSNKQMRTAPYWIINIPSIDRQIAVCDEIGEASFYTNKILDLYYWATHTKPQLSANEAVKWVKYNRDAGWAHSLVEEMLVGVIKKDVPIKTASSKAISVFTKCPDGWKSRKGLCSDGYPVTSTRTYNQILTRYKELKIAELVSGGLSQEEALRIVYEEFVGFYNKSGPTCQCISPKGLEDAAKLVGLVKIPKCPDSWMTAKSLDKDGYGDVEVIRSVLEKYESEKILQLKELCIKYGRDEVRAANLAKYIVRKFYIGTYLKSGNLCLCVSSRGLAELRKLGLLLKDKPQDKWKSSISLRQDGYGGDTTVVIKRLQKYQLAKKQQLAEKCSKAKRFRDEGRAGKLAEYIVQKWYIGIHGRGGNKCLRISPLGEKEAKELGLLVNLPECPNGWNTAAYLSNHGYPQARIILPLFEKYRQLKLEQVRAEFVASGKTEDEASVLSEQKVHEEFIGGYYVWGKPKPCLCISPKGLKEAAKLVDLHKFKKCPDSWNSGNDLYGLGYGTVKVAIPSIQEYQKRKIEHYEQKCRSEGKKRSDDRISKLADYITQRWYIGKYHKTGNPCLCISPVGLVEAENFGVLKKRTRQRGSGEGTPRGLQRQLG